jgi:hypothetical protein
MHVEARLVTLLVMLLVDPMESFIIWYSTLDKEVFIIIMRIEYVDIDEHLRRFMEENGGVTDVKSDFTTVDTATTPAT